MLYVRGNPHDYDHWQELKSRLELSGCTYFKKSEHSSRGADAYHRVDGELSVTDLIAPAAISQRFIDAGIGIMACNLISTGCSSQGRTISVYHQGWQTTQCCCCLPCAHSKASQFDCNNWALTRLLFEGTRAVGVEYLHSGMLHQVRVDREVILSAGAFDSPKLLMLSGIGDAALASIGISVVVDLPGVGQNLKDHVVVSVVYQATQNTTSTSSIGKLDYFCIAVIWS